MRKTITAVATAAAVASPIAAAHAATAPKKKVVVTTKTVQGPQGSAGQWGNVQVTLTVKKTTTIVGRKKTVTRRITKVDIPVYPNHTSRSVFINQQAVPMLEQETMQAQFDISKVDVIGGATATSYGFGQSLQAALLAAKKV
jgi:uncharacterized protein with FMN-binding domain